MLLLKKNIYIILLFVFASVNCFSETEYKDPRKTSSNNTWLNNIKPNFFPKKTIIQNNDNKLITLKAPFRAEDPSIVPISIQINHKLNVPIKTIYIFIDKNPSPLVGIFDFLNKKNRAELAMHVRVNDYSYIRAIAETNNGKLYMTKTFVKASGGCSAPASTSNELSMGKIKTRLLGKLSLSEDNLLQLKIRHPNYSGLESALPGQKKPETNYIRNIRTNLNGKPIMDFRLTFSISSNPSFRFYINPKQEGYLEIVATDLKNNIYTHQHMLDHNNVSTN